ncbi:MAG: hypothetical protein QOE97_1857 [Pseudonocardiales bacterium]|nr:hypothetical protein [Pseudonocardiales bacterium]
MIRPNARSSRLARWCAAAALVFCAGLVAPATASATATAPLTDHSVAVSAVKVTPSTPSPSSKPQSLTVVLDMTNTTDQSLTDVTVRAARATPIDSQTALDNAIAHPQPPDPSLSSDIETADHKPVTASLGPRGHTEVVFRTDTDIPRDAGICLCHNAIYPLYFAVHATGPLGDDVVVGSTQTFIPSFSQPDKMQPVAVSWIWPVLDRPHRIVGDTVFTDDDLASSISGGRLDRVLQVLTNVAGKVPITVVTDPELIDELAVMSSGDYQVGTVGKSTRGVGTAAARDWLARFRAALAAPNVHLSMTAFADPDVQSLTSNGLTWTKDLGADAQRRVTGALGGITAGDDVAWPVGEAASASTLDALVRQGATSVVLNDQALPLTQTTPPPNGLASLQTGAGPLTALVTSSTVQRFVGPVLSVGGGGYAQLPQLVAEVAIRTIQNPTGGGYLPIVAPRLVDPEPNVATDAILGTAHAFWSTGLTAPAAAQQIVPSEHGQLVAPDARAGGLSPVTISAAQDISRVVPALQTMLSATDADLLLGSLPAAIQRAESSEWRLDPHAGDAFAEAVSKRITTLESGVRIIKPSSGTYTLASNNSPLPLTIENALDVPVTVRVQVTSVNGLPGFTTHDVGKQQVAPNTKVTLHIPTQVERTGRFEVQAVLLTPSDEPIGTPVLLSVRSTALGAIGVVITVAAAAVLVLALLVRAVRRLHRRVRTPEQHRVPELV